MNQMDGDKKFTPFFTSYVDPNGHERLDGLLGAMLDNVTFSMNMSYSLSPPTDMMYGHVDGDGQIHGMPRAVLDGKADMVTGPLIAQDVFFEKLHELTRTRFGFSTGVLTFGLRREYVSQTTSFVDAVELQAWIVIATCAILLLLLLCVFKRIFDPRRQLTVYLLDWSFTFFGILLQEASSKPPGQLVERTAQGVWVLGCMFISYVFLGSMRANLVVLNPTERIHNMHQFLEFPKKPIFVGNGTPAAWLIEVYPGAVGDKLRQHFATNHIVVSPYERLGDVSLVEDVVKSGGAILYEKQAMVYFISQWCDATPYYFYIMPEVVARTDLSLYSSKALPAALNRELDKRIGWIEAFGVSFFREKKEINRNMNCMAGMGKKMSDNVSQVELSHLTSIFSALILGLSVSTAAYFVEAVAHCI